MSSPIIPLIEEYIESRNAKKGVPDKHYLSILESYGLSSEKARDILLKMDDEWTTHTHLKLKLKNAKLLLIWGIVLLLFSILISILSYLGLLFEGNFYVIFYGAMATGVLLINLSSR